MAAFQTARPRRAPRLVAIVAGQPPAAGGSYLGYERFGSHPAPAAAGAPSNGAVPAASAKAWLDHLDAPVSGDAHHRPNYQDTIIRWRG
jgi:hypothetical protein